MEVQKNWADPGQSEDIHNGDNWNPGNITLSLIDGDGNFIIKPKEYDLP